MCLYIDFSLVNLIDVKCFHRPGTNSAHVVNHVVNLSIHCVSEMPPQELIDQLPIDEIVSD